MRSRTCCPDCLAVGVETYFFSDTKLFNHGVQHRSGLIEHTCACGSAFENNEAGRKGHAKLCRLRRVPEKRQPDDGGGAEGHGASRKERAIAGQLCPKCGQDFNKRTYSAFVLHQEACDGLGVPLAPNDEGHHLDDMDHDEASFCLSPSDVASASPQQFQQPSDPHDAPHDQKADNSPEGEPEHAFGDFGPEPEWAENKDFRSFASTGGESYNGRLCDGILLNALRAKGHIDISNNALETIFDVLNNLTFREAFRRGELSKTYREARKLEKMSLHAKFSRVMHNGSLCHVRDLKSVVTEMMSDAAIVRDMDFDGTRDVVTEDDGICWGTHWTSFGNAGKRRAQVRATGAELAPLGLWGDEGETDSAGNPIWMLVLYPLNVARSLARRADCVFPIAYTYAASNIVDCVRYLLPQLVALRRKARWVQGVPKALVFSVEGIVGDFPAVAKLLLRVTVSAARHCCSGCLMDFVQNDDSRQMNDTARWLGRPAAARTQRSMEVAVRRMRVDRSYTETDSGMSSKCVGASVPLFAYFSSVDPDLDVFGVCTTDFMHKVGLGLFKEVGRVLADAVLGHADVRKAFKRLVLAMHTARLSGLEMTLFRPKDARKSSETDLLHLLSKGNLYAREYEALGPLFPYLFCMADPWERCVPRGALFALCDLVSAVTFMRSRRFPLNQTDDYWEALRRFSVEAYGRFCRHFDSLGKDRRFVKIHELLCHGWDQLRRHGGGCGTQMLEGLIHLFKSMTTNMKDQAGQVFDKFLAVVQTGRWVLGDTDAAAAVRAIIDRPAAPKPWKELPALAVAEDVRSAATAFLPGDESVVWLKWIRRAEAGGAFGPEKIYAAPQWHGKPRYDDLEVGEESFFRLRGLFAASGKVYAVGYRLHSGNLATMPWHLRMPVLHHRVAEPLRVGVLTLANVYPVVLLEHTIPIEDDFRQSLAPLGPADKVYHVHVFMTYGTYRYHREYIWHPLLNGTELWAPQK